MKKRLIVLLSNLTVVFSVAFAQQGEIIYRDFEPDSVLSLINEGAMLIDLDGCNQPDIRLSYYYSGPGVFPSIESLYPDSITLCAVEQDGILPEIEEWSNALAFDVVMVTHHYGFRIKHGEEFIYGWFETYLDYDESSQNSRRTVYWGFDRTAFCTIPDYPLRWGQTEITGIEENDTQTAFATVHPNPATGQVAVTGEGLKTAEVVDMLGQRVLTATGEGDELRIDMAKLPAGVYFVSVTDAEGRRCVRKVVKE